MIPFRTAILAVVFMLSAAPVPAADFTAECNKHLQAGDLDRAEESGIMAVVVANRNADAHFCLAEVWRLKGYLHRAQQQIETVDQLAKQDDYLALKLALNEITQEQHQRMQNELLLKTSSKLGAIAVDLRNYDQALVAYQRSIRLARELADKDAEAAALASLAGVQSVMKEYERSLESYREALKLTSRDAELSSLYNNMAVVYGLMGDFPVAEEHFAKSLALDEKLGDKRAQAIHLLEQGMAYQAKKDYGGAVAVFSKSRQISRGLKDAYGEGSADRHFGDMYRALGNLRLARASYAAARERFAAASASKDAESMAAAVEGLGELQPVPDMAAGFIAECKKHLGAGDYFRALESGNKAVAASHRSADAHFCLAEAWRLKGGDLGRAKMQMERADTVAKENDYLAVLRFSPKEITREQHQRTQNELLLKISGGLGAIAAEYRDYEHALLQYQRSLQLARVLADKDAEAAAFASLAGVYSNMGEYGRSLENYREALKLTSRDSEISSLYNNMALVYGQMSDFPVAEEYFAKSLALDEKRGDKRAQAIHLLSRGMNQQSKRDYAGAATMFSKSRQTSRGLKDAYGEGAADRHFGNMYRALGNIRLARASYAAARERFLAAHAKKDADSMTAAVKSLGEPQPVAGIEIGSTEVKALLLALRTDKLGAMDFKEILRQATGSAAIESKDGQALSPEDIESLADGVAAANKQLVKELKLDRSVLSVMVTGIPALAPNRDELAKRIKQDTGTSPLFMTDGEKARYDFSGSVAPGKIASGLLLKISDKATSISALDANGTVVSAELQQGAFTAVRQQEKNSESSAEKIIKGGQTVAFRQVLKESPLFSARKTVYMEGDVARVLAVFTRPDKDGNLVKITIVDLDKFVQAVKKRQASYFSPDISKIKDSGVQQWAEGEVAWVKQNFDPDDLMSGVLYLKMLMTELKVKEVTVTRGGSWLAGRLYETARMAERLEVRKR